MNDLFNNVAKDPKNTFSLAEKIAFEDAVLAEDGIRGAIQILPELTICNLIARKILPNNRTRLVMELRRYSNESYSSITNLATRSIQLYEKYKTKTDYTETNKKLDKNYKLLESMIYGFVEIDGMEIGVFDNKNEYVFLNNDDVMKRLASISKETKSINWSSYPLSVKQQRYIIETREILQERIVN